MLNTVAHWITNIRRGAFVLTTRCVLFIAYWHKLLKLVIGNVLNAFIALCSFKLYQFGAALQIWVLIAVRKAAITNAVLKVLFKSTRALMYKTASIC
ncbi:MAG: hypothetical protein AAI946_00355 [Candidatus Hodgkinia cicadicola]